MTRRNPGRSPGPHSNPPSTADQRLADTGKDFKADNPDSGEGLYVTTDRPTFSMLPKWVWDNDDVTAQDLRVYTVLADHADRDTGWCFIRHSVLGEEARCSRETAKRCVRNLASIGAITRHPRKDEKGRRRSNSYTVHFIGPFGQPRGRVISDPTGGVMGDPGDGVMGDPYNKNQREQEPHQQESAADDDDDSPSPAVDLSHLRGDALKAGERLVGELGDHLTLGDLTRVVDLAARAVERVDYDRVFAEHVSRFIDKIREDGVNSPVRYFEGCVENALRDSGATRGSRATVPACVGCGADEHPGDCGTVGASEPGEPSVIPEPHAPVVETPEFDAMWGAVLHACGITGELPLEVRDALDETVESLLVQEVPEQEVAAAEGLSLEALRDRFLTDAPAVEAA